MKCMGGNAYESPESSSFHLDPHQVKLPPILKYHWNKYCASKAIAEPGVLQFTEKDFDDLAFS